jgi:GT2 family glycosyltransferase
LNLQNKGNKIKISAIIVTYNNPEMLQELIIDIKNQNIGPNEIIIVDNSSNNKSEKIVKDNFSYIKYFKMAQNIGSAGGYCFGFEQAIKNSDFIWTLDDDVSLRNDTLEQLIKGFIDIEKKYPVGAVRSVGKYHKYNYPTKLDIVPWRGTLFYVDVVNKLGLPGKDFFLYGEDIEYSLRLEKYGYLCFWIPKSICIQKRVEKKTYSFLGKKLDVYPTSFRLYYAFRNELYIYLHYFKIKRVIKLLFYAIKVTAGIILFEKKLVGFKKIKAIYIGLWHGILGKLGKNEKYSPE